MLITFYEKRMLSGEQPLYQDKTNNPVSTFHGLSNALSWPITLALVFFTLAETTANGSSSHLVPKP